MGSCWVTTDLTFPSFIQAWFTWLLPFNTLRPRQNGRHFADDIFKCIFLFENVCFPIWISPRFVPKGQINIIPTFVQIMAWRRLGDKPLSEQMMVSILTHICVTRPQWVKIKGQGLLSISHEVHYNLSETMFLTIGFEQNDGHFADEIFKIFLIWIWINMSIKMIPCGSCWQQVNSASGNGFATIR